MLRLDHMPQTRVAILLRTAVLAGLAAILLTSAFMAKSIERHLVASLGQAAPMSTVIGAP